MNKENNNIEKLKEKLKEIKDNELKLLINNLIEERENLLEEIDYLVNFARLDPLTGIYNRSIIETIRNCSYVIMCDIDNFKIINDTLGHSVGDLVIKTIAQILNQNFRTNDYICRYGGDEFFISVDNCEEKIIFERLEKIKQEINKLIKLPGINVTISIGITKNTNNEKINELINQADIALYESKKKGKNLINLYKKETSITNKKNNAL